MSTSPTTRTRRTAIERAAGMSHSEATKTLQRMVTAASFLWLRISQMKVDPRAQRLLRPTWVKRHVSVFDPNQVGILCVSRRSDGSLWIIDGQHRIELLRAVGWGDQAVYCEVFDDLKLKEEAALFLQRNDRISVRSFDKFKNGVTAEHPAEMAITKIVNAVGMKISERDAEGSVCAVNALRRVYDGGGIASEQEGAVALKKTLETINDAWGGSAGNFTGVVVEALGLIYLRYGSAVDQSGMVSRLAKLHGGVEKIVQQGRNLRDAHSGTLPYNIADAIVLGYNRKRRTGKLERWRS